MIFTNNFNSRLVVWKIKLFWFEQPLSQYEDQPAFRPESGDRTLHLLMRQKTVNIFLAVGLAIVLFAVSSAKAQMNISFYPLEEQFNANSFNPAFLNPPHRFAFSIFPMGGTSFGYNNQQAVRQLVTRFLQGSTTDQDYRDLLQSMAARPTFNQTVDGTFLLFSYRSPVGNFSFRIRENENFSISMKGSLSGFVFKRGIQQTEVGISEILPAQALHYREYSIGYSLPGANHKFTAGIRAKLYFGKGAFSSGLSGIIKKDGSNYLLQASGKVSISIPEVTALNPNGSFNNITFFGDSKVLSYLTNNGNPGFGLDLGFKYAPTSKISFSGSITDLGKINWKTNLNSKDFSGVYQIDGTTVNSQTDSNGKEIITKINGDGAIADSISNLFQINYERSAFSLRMPVSVYAGINYQLNSGITLNLTDRYVVLKHMNYNSMALTARFDVNKNLSVNTGWAVIINSWFNLPFALLLKRDFGQIYIGTDNLAAFFAPSISEFAGVSFGTCFYLFRRNEVHESYSRYFPFFKHRKIRSNSNGLLIGNPPD